MRYTIGVVLIAAIVAGASADFVPQLKISLGIRETNTTVPVGGNGGSANGIEWVNLRGQTLICDGTWQQFTFNFATDALTAFAGTTADGILTYPRGVIESIRFDTFGSQPIGIPMQVWIDDILNPIDPPGPPPPTVQTVSGFEGYADGAEVIFQEPEFSGSTNVYIVNPAPGIPNVSGVDNTVAYSGSASYKVQWTFERNPAAPLNDPWLRLTTFNTPNMPNPAIDFENATLSFWLRGVPEPTTALLLGLGALLLRRR